MRSRPRTRLSLAPGLLAFIYMCLGPNAASAEAYSQIGYGRLVTNDLIGDGRDRWQTGSYASSYAFGRAAWTGTLPATFGALFEFRYDAAVASPANLRNPEAGDRLLSGLMQWGLATQFAGGGWETDLGAHLVFVGPETGLVDFQTGLHDVLPGAASPSKAVRDAQVDLLPQIGASAEFARPISFGPATLRPFLALEAGVETFARAGLDLTIGSFGTGAVTSRDKISGHRFRVVDGIGSGFSVVLGGDVTALDHSQLLRETDGVTPESQRTRLRAGLHWQRGDGHLFYGATWLSPETEFQDSGQVIGSLRLDWRF